MRKRLAIERPQIERKIEDRRRFYQVELFFENFCLKGHVDFSKKTI